MVGNAAQQRVVLEHIARYLNNTMGGSLIFKGGLFLGYYTAYPRRTQDVDVDIADATHYEPIKRLLKTIGEQLKSEGLVSRYEVDPDVVIGKSGGAKYYGLGGEKLASVDVNLSSEAVDFSIRETNEYGRIRLSSLEQVIADKISAVYSPKRFRRTKDIYDLWCIWNNCIKNWNPQGTMLILQRSKDVEQLKQENPFSEESLAKLKHAYDRLSISTPEGNTMVKPEFGAVIEATSAIAARLGWL